MRLVAGGGTHEGFVGRALSDRLAEEIKRTTNLVGAHRRQVLALKPDIGAIAGGEMLVELQRRRRKEAAHRFLGSFDILSVHGHYPLLLAPFAIA